MKRMSWDDYLLGMAFLASRRSHDTETQHGAVIVDPDHRILGIGYNGFPRHGPDDDLPDTGPDKYPYMIHAELNAILNTTGDTEGGAIYITGHPCPQCTLAIIQIGIKTIWHSDVQSKMVTRECEEDVRHLCSSYGINLGFKPTTNNV